MMDPSELKKIQEHQEKMKTSQFKDKEFRMESQSKQDFNLTPRKNSHIDQFYEPIPVYSGGNAPIDTKKNTFNPIANLGNLKPKLQIPMVPPMNMHSPDNAKSNSSSNSTHKSGFSGAVETKFSQPNKSGFSGAVDMKSSHQSKRKGTQPSKPKLPALDLG
jgi:hypothetical protein